jgi:hypothetical protein
MGIERAAGKPQGHRANIDAVTIRPKLPPQRPPSVFAEPPAVGPGIAPASVFGNDKIVPHEQKAIEPAVAPKHDTCLLEERSRASACGKPPYHELGRGRPLHGERLELAWSNDAMQR